MKKNFFLFLIPLCVSFSSFNGENLKTADEIKIRLGSVIPKDSPWEKGLNEYIKWAEAKSGGRFKYKTYLGGVLGGEVEMIKSIALGTLDGGAFSSAAIAEALNIPELQVFEMPFLFNSDEEADYVMDAMFSKMSEILDKKGIKLVMWGTNGWRGIGTRKKPVLKPSDLRGLKMRSQESDVYVNFYKANGATPVPISTPEVLVALKTGMVDGFDQTPIFAVSTGWITAVKYFTLTNHIYQPGAVIMSKKLYDRLPAELKKILIADEKRDELTKKSRLLVRTDNAEILKTMEASTGIKLVKFADGQRAEFKKVVQVVYTQMEPKIGKELMNEMNFHISNFRTKK